MSWGIVAGAAVGLVGSAISADAQRSAGNKASDAQSQAALAGIEEQRRQFDAIQKLLSPYVSGGTAGLGGQMDLLGLNGNGKQAAAINALQNSSQFTSLAQQGEEAILANASATGGLRGGDTQGALAQFRPQLLNQMIAQQYDRLGGLASLGQNAAAGVGNAGMATGQGISALLQQQGAARAGAALSGGAANMGLINGVGQGIGAYFGYGGRFGGGTQASGFTGEPGHTSVDWGF